MPDAEQQQPESLADQKTRLEIEVLRESLRPWYKRSTGIVAAIGAGVPNATRSSRCSSTTDLRDEAEVVRLSRRPKRTEYRITTLLSAGKREGVW